MAEVTLGGEVHVSSLTQHFLNLPEGSGDGVSVIGAKPSIIVDEAGRVRVQLVTVVSYGFDAPRRLTWTTDVDAADSAAVNALLQDIVERAAPGARKAAISAAMRATVVAEALGETI